MPRRVLNGLACAVAIIGVLAAPAQAAPGDISTFAGTGAAAFAGDGGPATNARLNLPTDVEPTADGGFLIAEYGNSRVRRVSPAGVITTVAGTGAAGTSGDGGPATSAQLAAPTGVAVTGDGGFLVADAAAHAVRRVSPGGTITRVAGTGSPGATGDGGPAVSARLNAPVGVAALAEGGFLVTEYEGHRVRRVSAAGVITRVAGTGTAGFSGDGGAATAARLNQPVGVSTTSDGGFLIGDSLNDRVRKVSADGTVSTIAGTGAPGYTGDGGPAMLAQLNAPYAAAENTNGAILVADGQNNRLRLVEGRAPAAGEPPPAAVPPLAAVALLHAPTGVVHATARTVRLPVVCPVAAAEACRGTIRLVVRSRARRAAASRAVVIARGRFSVAAGNSKLVKLPLTRAGRRLLRKRRVVKVTAVVARRGGPNIGQSSERSTVRVKRKRRRGRAAGRLG